MHSSISATRVCRRSPCFQERLNGVGGHKWRQRAAASTGEQVTIEPKVSRFGDKKILVAGATGRTGSAIVEALVKEQANVCAFVRNKSKANERFPSIEAFEGDVAKYESITRAMQDVSFVICATGAKNFLLNPVAPYLTDCQGVGNLVSAAEKAKVERFVLVSSIGVDERNPLITLAFWGILLCKKLGEQWLQRSNLEYTIIRPGGLLDKWTDRVKEGNVIMEAPGTFGFGKGKQRGGAILRSQVAQCCLEALTQPSAKNKTVEIITKPDAPSRSFAELFEAVE